MKNSYIIISLIFVLLFVLAGCGVQKIRNTGTDNEDTKNNAKILPGLQKTERKDDWETTEELSDIEPEKLTLSPLEAESIKVSFTIEEKKDEWDSYTGGGDVEYVSARLEGKVPDVVKKIFDDYNDWAVKTADDEMAQAGERWERYHASSPDSFIALTPRVGMHLKRCDTSIVSYITMVDRYNRDYEPDDTFYHGYTYDAQSGRKLSLNDFITDPDRLCELVCEGLLTANADYTKETVSIYEKENFKNRISESIRGCRDDGRFAWAVNPAGFEFYLTDPFYQGGYMMHDTEEILVPFALCKDILYQDAFAPYDFILEFHRLYRKDICGYEGLLSHEKEKGYYGHHLVQKNGDRYLYLSKDNETQVYSLKQDEPAFITSIFGAIYDPIESDYRQSLDPDGFRLTCDTSLVRELNSMVADACVGEDGVPKRLSLYSHLYGGVEPLSVLVPFEAEVFDNEKDTEPEIRMLEKNTYMDIIRTDGETFIDLLIHDGKEENVCRFYVTGNDEDGFTVNGHPAEEVLNLQGWLEE
ncbi:MAG: hypothetical protein K5886_05610 [Lachnospiraceae bacterium]|nr:hypothetical protein [Lachnospiraceae bacterium]